MGSRNRYENHEKAKHVAEYEEWAANQRNEGLTPTVRDYRIKQNLPAKFENFLSTKEGGWRNKSILPSLLKSAGGTRRHKLCVAEGRPRPFTALEDALFAEVVDLRRAANPRKVSGAWLRARALSLSAQMNMPTFKASYGWLVRFTRARGMRFRKRQKGNVGNVQEQEIKMLSWLKQFRFMLRVLPAQKLLHASTDLQAKWGRFLPQYRFNVDQVFFKKNKENEIKSDRRRENCLSLMLMFLVFFPLNKLGATSVYRCG